MLRRLGVLDVVLVIAVVVLCVVVIRATRCCVMSWDIAVMNWATAKASQYTGRWHAL